MVCLKSTYNITIIVMICAGVMAHAIIHLTICPLKSTIEPLIMLGVYIQPDNPDQPNPNYKS